MVLVVVAAHISLKWVSIGIPSSVLSNGLVGSKDGRNGVANEVSRGYLPQVLFSGLIWSS